MAYTLDAFVYPLTNWWPAHLPAHPRVLLSEDPALVMVPLVEPVYEQITGGDEEALDHFSRLTEPLRRFGEDLSAGGPVLYICGEGSAGGTQESIGWLHGQVSFGPAHTADYPDADEHFVYAPRVRDGAINQALRHLGVHVTHFDEFASVGLDRHRSNEAWLGWDD